MTADEGGEAPCFAHLLDQPPVIDDTVLARGHREFAVAVVIAGADGTIVFWNDAAERVFGWSADEAIGQSLDLIVPARQRDRHWAGYRRTMVTGETKYGDRLLDVPSMHRDGRRLSIAFTVTLLHRPGESLPCGIAAVVRDDTERWQERRRLDEELAASRTASAQRWPPGRRHRQARFRLLDQGRVATVAGGLRLALEAELETAACSLSFCCLDTPARLQVRPKLAKNGVDDRLRFAWATVFEASTRRLSPRSPQRDTASRRDTVTNRFLALTCGNVA